MALQRTRRPRIRSGRSLCSLGSPLNARPLDATRKGRAPAYALLLLSLFAVGGCSYAKTQPTVVAGRRFPFREAASLGRGVTQTETKQLLGEPFEIAAESSGETWRYFACERSGDIVKLLGLVTISRPHDFGAYTVTLSFRDGLLDSVINSSHGKCTAGKPIVAPATTSAGYVKDGI
jgi:hypothetical protein